MATEASLQESPVVRQHLAAGEQILWAGQPAPWRIAGNMRWNVTVGLPLTAILVYLASCVPELENPRQLLFLLPLAPLALLLGPGLLCSSLIGPFMARWIV